MFADNEADTNFVPAIDVLMSFISFRVMNVRFILKDQIRTERLYYDMDGQEYRTWQRGKVIYRSEIRYNVTPNYK